MKIIYDRTTRFDLISNDKGGGGGVIMDLWIVGRMDISKKYIQFFKRYWRKKRFKFLPIWYCSEDWDTWKIDYIYGYTWPVVLMLFDKVIGVEMTREVSCRWRPPDVMFAFFLFLLPASLSLFYFHFHFSLFLKAIRVHLSKIECSVPRWVQR